MFLEVVVVGSCNAIFSGWTLHNIFDGVIKAAPYAKSHLNIERRHSISCIDSFNEPGASNNKHTWDRGEMPAICLRACRSRYDMDFKCPTCYMHVHYNHANKLYSVVYIDYGH